MPIYEYRCTSCSEVTEIRQKFSDPPLTECEKCGGRLDRLISAPGLQFKGSGWYITDYARASRDSNGKAHGETAKKPESKSEKSESNSEAKAAAPAPAASAKKSD